MRYFISALILTFGLLNGCSSPLDLIPKRVETVTKVKYIKQKCPKQVELPLVPTYTVTDWYLEANGTRYSIDKKQEDKSRQICHTLRLHDNIRRGL